LALALVGCAGDDTDDSASTETTAPVATTAAPSTTAAPRELTGLDESFGTDGVLASPLSATDPDRFMAVAAGEGDMFYGAGFVATGGDQALAVARFDADGALDKTFGTNGIASVNVAVGGKAVEIARGVVVQADGKVVVAGPVEHAPGAAGNDGKDTDIAVARFDDTGKIDTSFGTAGVARIDLGVGKAVSETSYLGDTSWGIGELTGGKIVVFGSTPNQAADRTDADYVLFTLTSAGARDTAFGTNGLLTVDINSSGDSPRHLLVEPEGRIAATGYSRDGDGVVSPVIIRASAAGVLDATFGNGGVATAKVLPGVAESYNVQRQGDDYILAGYGRGADANEKVDLISMRFTADGKWDETYGTAGVTRVDVAKEDDRARNVLVLPDDRVLVVGSGKSTADNVDAMVVLLDEDGKPVTTFGESGRVQTDLGGPADAWYGVTLSSDGSSVMVVGYKGVDAASGSNDDAAIARLHLSDS
jgi:uncharacterized delta-60 repeat protein